ncbi:uncharacterized protein J5F26_010747 [Ciconia maguari]
MSVQHPEILIRFSRPVDLLLLQIPFPSYPYFPLAHRKHAIARSLLGAQAGVALLLFSSAHVLYRAVQGVPALGEVAVPTEAISGVTGMLGTSPGAAGSSPVAPVAPRSWAVACESALYQRRVRGGCRQPLPSRGGWRCRSRAGPPSLPPGCAAHQHTRTARSHISELWPRSTSHGVASAPSPRSPRVPRRGKSSCSWAASRQRDQPAAGLLPPAPCPAALAAVPALLEHPGCQIFPVLSSTAVCREVDSDSEPGCGRSRWPVQGTRDGGSGRGPGICLLARSRSGLGTAQLGGAGGTPGLWPWHGGNEDPLSSPPPRTRGQPVPGLLQGTSRSRAQQSRAG